MSNIQEPAYRAEAKRPVTRGKPDVTSVGLFLLRSSTRRPGAPHLFALLRRRCASASLRSVSSRS